MRSLSCMRATERASAGVRSAGCTRSPVIWSRYERCSSRRVADVLRDVGPHDSVQIDFVNAPMRSGIDTMLPAPYFISPSLIRASRNGLWSCANVDAWAAMPKTQGGTTPPCVLIPSSFERQNYRRSASRLAVSALSMRARLSSSRQDLVTPTLSPAHRSFDPRCTQRQRCDC